MRHVIHVDHKVARNCLFADRRNLVRQAADRTRRQDREDHGCDQQQDRDDKRCVIMSECLDKTAKLAFFFDRSFNVCTHNPNSSLLSCDKAIS